MKDEFTTHGLNIERIMDQAVAAAVAFRRFWQKETDRVVEAVFKAGFANRVRLAKLACKETKLGRWEDIWGMFPSFFFDLWIDHRGWRPGSFPAFSSSRF